MAKAIKTISMWDVGLVSKHDPRDLKDGAFVKATDIMIDNPGEVRLIGGEQPHAISQLEETSVTAGYGLFAFNSDHHIKMTGVITAFTDYNSTVTDTIQVTSANHYLTTGTLISIKGTDNFDGQNISITKIDKDNFYFSSTSHATADGSDDSDSGTSYWAYNPGHSTEDLDYSSEPKQGSFKYLTVPYVGDSNGPVIHIYHSEYQDLLLNRISMGSQSAYFKPVYYFVDNALRICDGHFGNENNNRVKWYGFIPKREQCTLDNGGSATAIRTIPAGWYDEDSTLAPIGYWGDGAYNASNMDLNPNGSSNYYSFINYDTDTAAGSMQPWDTNTDTDYFVDGVPKRGLSISIGASGSVSTSGDFQGSSSSEHESLEIGVAVVYDDEPSRQESLIVRPLNNTVVQTSGSTAWANDMSLNFSIGVRFATESNANDDYGDVNAGGGTSDGVDFTWPNRATGLAFYIVKDGFGEIEDPLYLGTLDFDKSLGFTDHAGNLTNWNTAALGTSSSGLDLSHIGHCHFNIKRVPTITYASRNGYSSSGVTQGLRCRYKTATMANRRMYVGNVRYLDGPLEGKNFEDRLLRSPVNKFDVFPHDSYIDVAINDGDKIVALESYKDKLLQFKRHTLYVINISTEDEYLEETFSYMGVKQPWSICKFNEGVVWANETGLFIYDGRTVTNAVKDRIDDEEWSNFCGNENDANSPCLGYIPKENQIIISSGPTADFGGSVYVFDLTTNTITYGVDKIIPQNRTNFISDLEDNLLFGVTEGSSVENIDIDTQVANVVPALSSGTMYITTPGHSERVYVEIYKGGGWVRASNHFINEEANTNDKKRRLAEKIADAINNYRTHTAFAWSSYEEQNTLIYGWTMTSKTKGTGENTSSTHLRIRKTGDTAPSNTWTITTSGLQGAVEAVAQEERVAFARNTADGLNDVLYIANLTVYEDPTFDSQGASDNVDAESGLTPVSHNLQFPLITNNSQNSNAEIRDYYGKSDNTGVLTTATTSDTGNFIDLSKEFEIESVGDTDNDEDSNAGKRFDIRSLKAGKPFNINFVIEGRTIIKQFSSNSQTSKSLDIITKDFIFGNPHVRKKVYKLYLTYKAADLGSTDSNVYIEYIIDGKEQDTRSNWMPMVIRGTSTQYLAGSTNWSKVELVPKSDNADKLNSVYSVSFRIYGNGAVQDFKLNDLSIVYRSKSVK